MYIYIYISYEHNILQNSSIYLWTYIFLADHQSIYQSIYPSIHPSIYLLYLSIYLYQYIYVNQSINQSLDRSIYMGMGWNLWSILVGWRSILRTILGFHWVAGFWPIAISRNSYPQGLGGGELWALDVAALQPGHWVKIVGIFMGNPSWKLVSRHDIWMTLGDFVWNHLQQKT